MVCRFLRVLESCSPTSASEKWPMRKIVCHHGFNVLRLSAHARYHRRGKVGAQARMIVDRSWPVTTCADRTGGGASVIVRYVTSATILAIVVSCAPVSSNHRATTPASGDTPQIRATDARPGGIEPGQGGATGASVNDISTSVRVSGLSTTHHRVSAPLVDRIEVLEQPGGALVAAPASADEKSPASAEPAEKESDYDPNIWSIFSRD